MRARAGAGLLLAALLSACSTAGSTGRPGGALRVVAAENVWGSIATQVAGGHAAVSSLVANPAADPHSYEPTAADARAVASADLVVVNGAGYDAWAQKLLGASPSPRRVVIDVGRLLGVPAGGNPHLWYDPAAVQRVAEALATALAGLDHNDAAAFRSAQQAFTGPALARYRTAAAAIRRRYAGVPVGASESIFAVLVPALGLDLRTPAGYLTAVTEGTDPTAADKAAADALIAGHRVAVYLFNSQNATPDVQAQLAAARAAGVPVVSMTETLAPAGASFQDWQSAQLEALAAALGRATGR